MTTRDDGAVSVGNTRTLALHRLAIVGGPADGAPAAPAFGAGGSLIVTSRFGLVERVDARTGHVTGRFRGHDVDVLPPVTSADGRILFTGAPDGARVWDVTTLRQLGATIRLWTPGSVAISPDASRLAVTVIGGTIDILDARTRRRLARLRVDGSEIVASAFARDGRLLVAGSQDGGLRVFSAPDWRPLGPAVAAHDSAIESVDLSPDRSTLVATGQDGWVSLWDVATRRPLGTPLPGPGRQDVVAAFAPDGGQVFAIYADGRGYRWDVRPDAWARHACEVAGRALTPLEWHELLRDRPYTPACTTS